MTKKSKPASKKKDSKAPAKKAVKKVAAKKKSSVVIKTASKKKHATPIRKAVAPTIKKKVPKKTIRRKPAVTPKKETIETDLPPVEEKSPEINNDTITPVENIVTKSTQKAAARQYDNHNIRLSGKKGGLKPSGKKPLW